MIPPDEQGDPTEEAAILRNEVKRATEHLRSIWPDDQEALAKVFVSVKLAADMLYALKGDLGDRLLASGLRPGDALQASHGRRVGVRANWETEVLNEDAVTDWLASAGVDEPWRVVTKSTLTEEARKVIREAVEVDGELVPGVSAGFGAPQLYVPRKS